MYQNMFKNNCRNKQHIQNNIKKNEKDRKTWEMRKTATRHVSPMELIEMGSPAILVHCAKTDD